MEDQFKRRAIFVLGIASVAVGEVLFALGLVGLTVPIACAITGCPSIFSDTYRTYWVEIFAGLSAMVVGFVLMLATRESR